jgi:Cytochrome P460
MKPLRFLTATIIVVILFKSCVDHDISDPEIVDATDESLFNEANESGYTYYQSGNTISPAAQSPHGTYKLRFNSTALQALDGNSELPENGQFPNGSILVKEVYQNSTLSILAVMKKAPTDASAGDGWLWAEYRPDGSSAFSITAKGNGCISCHNDTPNRDLVRTFDLH